MIATAAMCAVVPFARVTPEDPTLLERATGGLLLPIGAGMMVYVVAHLLMRSPELKALRRSSKDE